MKIYFLTVIAVLMTLVHTGCTVTGVNYFNDQPVGSIAASKIDLRKIRTGSGDRTPVILIHGLWGAELREKNSKDLRAWGDFSCYPPTAEARFKSMALNFRHKTSAQDLFASDILRTTRVNFMGMNFDLENYSRIIALLEALGYVPEKSPLPENSHYCTLFIYHYDWRKSIDENAAGLADFIEEKKQYLSNQFKNCQKHRNKEVRFDLLGHSMGGMIARYYVEYGTQKIGSYKDALPDRNWYGAKNVRKLIMAGTPNSGYVDALWELVNGVRFDAFAPVFPAEVLATFPSCYQLLPEISKNTVRFVPSGKAVDIFDIRVWRRYKWGLLADSRFNREFLSEMYPELDESARWAAVAEYVDKMLNRAGRLRLLFSRHIGLPPEPLKYYLFASAGIDTNSMIEVDESDGSLTFSALAPGDGKVTLRSAGFEQSPKDNPLICSDVYVLDGGHIGFMESTLFACNLALILYSEL